uniref:DUF4116 domain-containing protein n=1 Tax=viral metagenome TaxID=1070528 RepID=A0A6C0H7Z9_9ZZZZ
MTLINVLVSELYYVIKLTNQISNKSILLLDMITPLVNKYSIFSILSNGKLIHNPLIHDDTTELENHLYNMCNSSINEHTLYIIEESYYDNENRTLEDYKNYLNKLRFLECMEIAGRQDLTMFDKYLVIGMIKVFPEQLSRLNDEFRDCKEIVQIAVTLNGHLLNCVSERLKNDKDVVLAAVKKNGRALYYASTDMQNIYEVVEAAVTQDGGALEYAFESFKKNENIVKIAVNTNGLGLKHAKTFNNNKEIVLAAVKKWGTMLEHASDLLKKDEEVVFAAVTTSGHALIHADEIFKSNKDIVLAAIKTNPEALQYASDILKDDEELVLIAINKDIDALQYASGKLIEKLTPYAIQIKNKEKHSKRTNNSEQLQYNHNNRLNLCRR